MSQIILRDYQSTAIKEIRDCMIKGKKNVLFVCPTGGGKTVVISQIVLDAAKKDKRVLILAHRKELLKQIKETLIKFNITSSICAAGSDWDRSSQVQIGSIMTVVNRLKRFIKPDLILVDEAHHYRKGSTYDKVLEFFNVHTIGVTATPCRLSGEALGDFFQDMVMGPSIQELTSNGHLCDYEIYASNNAPSQQIESSKMVAGDFSKSDMADAMNKPSVTGDAINEYIKHGYGKQAVVFCVNVAHSESVAESFNQAGINAYSIDGKTDAFTRDKVIEEFKNGDIKVLTNCQIVTEGFDLPSLEVLIQLRPTASLGLYMQMVGRVLRVAEGKKKAIILDHADNFKRHGFPCDKREWSLEKKIKAQKKKTFSTKMCTECFAVNSSTARVCFNCKSVFNVKEREGPEFIEGELSKVDKERFKKEKKKEQSNAQTYEELVELGRARGYKPGWARFIYESRKKKRNK